MSPRTECQPFRKWLLRGLTVLPDATEDAEEGQQTSREPRAGKARVVPPKWRVDMWHRSLPCANVSKASPTIHQDAPKKATAPPRPAPGSCRWEPPRGQGSSCPGPTRHVATALARAS